MNMWIVSDAPRRVAGNVQKEKHRATMMRQSRGSARGEFVQAFHDAGT